MAAGLSFRDAIAGIARIAPTIAAGRLSPSAAVAPAYAALRAQDAPSRQPPAPPPAIAEAAQYYLDELSAIARADLSGLPPRSAIVAIRSMARSAIDNAPAAVRAASAANAEIAAVHGTVQRLATRLIRHHAFGQSEAAEIAQNAGRRLVEAGLALTPESRDREVSLSEQLAADADRLEALVSRLGESARSGAPMAQLSAEASAGLRGESNALRALRRARLDAILDAAPDEADALLRSRAIGDAAADALSRVSRQHEAMGEGCRNDAVRALDHARATIDSVRSTGRTDVFIPGRR